jgi:hypothetical protein
MYWDISLKWFTDSSVGIATGYELQGRGSISDNGKRFFSTLQDSDKFWGSTSILSKGTGGKAAGP